jgi:hypothetical protein
MFLSISMIYVIRIIRDIRVIMDIISHDDIQTSVLVGKTVLTAGICISLHRRLFVALALAESTRAEQTAVLSSPD